MSMLNKQIDKDLKPLKLFMDENKEIIIIKADKSKKLIIMYKTDYISKMNTLLEDKGTYKLMRQNPCIELADKLNKFSNKLFKYGYVDKFIKNKIAANNFTEPRIRRLINAHKPCKNIRPIINNINGPNDALANFYKPMLEILNKNNKYDVKNVIEIKNKLSQIPLGTKKKYSLVSLDIKQFLTNIPINEVINSIEKQWELIKENKKMFIGGLELCIKSNYFKFNDCYYKQINGLAMGGRLSVILSTFYLNKILDEQIKISKIEPILILKYIDDILLLSEYLQYRTSLNCLNKVNKKFIFTIEELHKEDI